MRGCCARRRVVRRIGPQAAAISRAMPVPTGLSRRGREELQLLVVGPCNRQVAQALFFSPRTVQRHVADVYPKIGVHRRAEATIHAVDHGPR